MSRNTGGPDIAPGMENIEAAIQTRLGRLDAAITDILAVDVTTSDNVISTDDAQKCTFIGITASNAAHITTLPAIKKSWLIVNLTAFPTAVKRGTSEILLSANGSAVFYADGTENGLYAIGGVGGGGGSGIEEAPEDGKQYGRQSGAWSEIVHGEGGDGGGGGGPAADPIARGFRVVYQPGDGYFAFAVVEFRAYDSNLNLVAWPSGTAFSSNSESTPAANAADGNSASRWESASFGGQRSTFPVYWQALFPEGVTREIAYIEIEGRADGSDPRVAEQAGFAPEFYVTKGGGVFYLQQKTFLANVPSGLGVINRYRMTF